MRFLGTLVAAVTALALAATAQAASVVYVGAGGRANHAGTARSMGSVAAGDGNSLYVGIEWMLSGTQPISDAQYDAAATTNAVLLDIMGSSVKTVGCHFQTSVTGKWDIGDPRGVPFNGHKVLDVPKFRQAVQAGAGTTPARYRWSMPITRLMRFPRPSASSAE